MGSRPTKVAAGLRPRMRIPDRASDSETALMRYLVYGLLPAIVVPYCEELVRCITKADKE